MYAVAGRFGPTRVRPVRRGYNLDAQGASTACAVTTPSMNKFGKYVLLAELGHGGMADVFLAVSNGPEGLGFRKLAVVKRLRKSLIGDPEFVTMLVDEGRLAARLNHPNTVQTY